MAGWRSTRCASEAAQLGVAQDDVPGLGGRLRGGFLYFPAEASCSAGELLRLVVSRLSISAVWLFLPGCLGPVFARLCLATFFIGSAAFRGALTLCRPLPYSSRRRWCPSPPACPRSLARGYRGCLGGTVGCRFAGSAPRRPGQRRDRCFPPAGAGALRGGGVKSANSFCQSSWPSLLARPRLPGPGYGLPEHHTSCLARSRVVAATSRLASLASGLP